MAIPATRHAAQAKEHAENAVRELHRAIDQINQVVSWLQASRDRSVKTAATHLFAVHELVGSTTANLIAVAFVDIGKKIDDTDGTALLAIRQHLESMIEELQSQADRTRQLAQQLGA